MYNKKTVYIVLSLFILCSLFGCGKKFSAESEKDKETVANEELLQNAIESFNSAKKRGVTTVFTNSYSDGSTLTEEQHIIYDSSRKTIYRSCLFDDGQEIENFYFQEEGSTYCYEKNTANTTGWIRYLENIDENNETSFETLLNEFQYSFTEENGYTNVTITNEGTQTLNNENAIVLHVTALPDNFNDDNLTDHILADEDYSITREDIIREYEWSEESVHAVDGFSELLDEYVAYLNHSDVYAKSIQSSFEEIRIWISEDTHMLLQVQSVTTFEETDSALSADIEDQFFNESWKVSWVQSDLDSGLTVEESLEILELEREVIEEQLEYYEDDSSSEDTEPEPIPTKIEYIKTFFSEDKCPPMDVLPEEYTETTYEDYYNEFAI